MISRACSGRMSVSEMSSQASLHTAKPTINPWATRWTHNKPKLRDRERPDRLPHLRGEPRQSTGTDSERTQEQQRVSNWPLPGHQRWKICQNMVTRPYWSQKFCQLPGRADCPGGVSQEHEEISPSCTADGDCIQRVPLEPWGCRTDIEAPLSTEGALASQAGDHSKARRSCPALQNRSVRAEQPIFLH